jgi:hypothetical protein
MLATTMETSGNANRFARCSKRDKHGNEACPARPVRVGALEDFITQRIQLSRHAAEHPTSRAP